jgi:hypothetical protein
MYHEQGALQRTGSIAHIRSGNTKNRTHEQKTESHRKAMEGHGQQNHKEAHAIRVLHAALNQHAQSIHGPPVVFRTQFDGLRNDALVHFGPTDHYVALQMKSCSATAKRIQFKATNGYQGMFMVCVALGPHDAIRELLWFREALTIKKICLTAGRPSTHETIERARSLGIAKLYTELRNVVLLHSNPAFLRTRDQWVYDADQCHSPKIARGLEAMKLVEDILGEPIEAPVEQNGPVDGLFQDFKLSFKIATKIATKHQTCRSRYVIHTARCDQKHYEENVTHVIIAVPDASSKATSLCVTTPDRITWIKANFRWNSSHFPGVEGITTREQLMAVLQARKSIRCL